MNYSTKIIFLFILCLFILFSAFFSAAETAYTSVSQSKIEIKAKQKKRSAILIKKHYSKFGVTLATILIFNTLVNIAASSLAAYLFPQIVNFNGDISPTTTIITTLIMTPILVIFGEIFPKLLAKKYSYGYLSKIVYIIEILSLIFYPITYALSKFALSSKITNTEKEIKTIIDLAKSENVLEKREATLAKNALDLDSIYVYKIMTKRKKVKTIDINTPIFDVLKFLYKTGYSRIPITKNNIYVGVVFLKDILIQKISLKKYKLKNFVIKVPNISKNIIIIKALELMRREKKHIAFVVESTHNTKVLGIITIEDILEEIVGEIYDEHDPDISIREIGLHKFLAIGTTKMSELEKITKTHFKNSKNITIKQWIQARIKRKIKKNLIYVYNHKYKFQIIDNKKFKETQIEITQK